VAIVAILDLTLGAADFGQLLAALDVRGVGGFGGQKRRLMHKAFVLPGAVSEHGLRLVRDF
jgi:hypothetical protein